MADYLQARVDAMSVTVTVGGRPWRRVTELAREGPSSTAFLLVVDAAGEARVQFGNGVQGQRPPAGATIDVSYRTGGGQGRVSHVATRGVGGIAVSLPSLLARPTEGLLRATTPRRWPP